MSRIPITNLFNAYDLQVNPLDEDKISSQQVVNYCEARFRVALQAMMRRSEKDQKWMYQILFQEMVFLITWLFDSLLISFVLAVMLFLHRCGCCDRPATSHSSDHPLPCPGYVPSRNDSGWIVPTRPRAHDVLRW